VQPIINKLNVFVTDAAYKHTLSVVRSLGRRGLNVYCGSSSASPPIASFSRYTKQTLVYPDPKAFPDLFKAFIKKSSKKLCYGIVIPVGYDTTFALSKAKNELDEVQIPVSDFESLSTAASKKKTIFLAKELGIPIPHTLTPTSSMDLKGADLNYPLVVKGVRDSGFVKYAYDLQSLKQNINEIYRQQGEYPLVQECIPGAGHGFFTLFNNGEPRAIFMHRRVRMYPITGGPSTCAESVYEPKLLKFSLKLLKALNWHGVAMVEFIKDLRDSEFKLMEINPKFWGSLDLAIASGIDFPQLLYTMVLEGDVKPTFNYKTGVRFMWPFPDDFLHVIDKPLDIKPFVLDLFNPRICKNIDFTDLCPNLTQLPETAYLLRSKLRRSASTIPR